MAITNRHKTGRLSIAILLLLLLFYCCCCIIFNIPTVAASSESSTKTKLVSEETLATGRILTPTGEVSIDSSTGARLPEELDDGELEGGDQHSEDEWSYENQLGWFKPYPQCEGNIKRRQSPIDIVTDNVVFKPRMRLSFINYHQDVVFEFKNTHHSISLTPVASVTEPRIQLNWIEPNESWQVVEYDLREIHFHWGDGINKGSEHEINDQRAAAEMHLVHYRRGVDKAKLGVVENSVAVVGVLIESDSIEHNKLEGLVERTERVNGTDTIHKDTKPELLINLLPENHHSFYTYNGSLTTPPCYEVVTWIILSEPVYMKQEHLIELSYIEAQHPGRGRAKIASNHRDIQPLLERPVYASFNATDLIDSSEPFVANVKATTTNERKKVEDKNGRINKLRISVKHAHKVIEEARRNLLKRIGVKKKKVQTEKEINNDNSSNENK